MDANLDENFLKAKTITQLKPVDLLPNFKVTSQGLSKDEALLRQKKYGKNKLPDPSSFSPFKLLFKQFTHFMAILLWIAGFLAIIAEMPELAIASWAVIVINAFFSFFQEYKADKALTELANNQVSRLIGSTSQQAKIWMQCLRISSRPSLKSRNR